MRLLLFFALLAQCFTFPFEPKEGDLVFQNMSNSFGGGVQDATGSRWSHIGILFKQDGEWQVIEAVFRGVRFTKLETYISRVKGRIGVARLKNLPQAVLEKARTRSLEQLGKPYDRPFVLNDMQAVYCSELAYDAFNFAFGTRVFQASPMDFSAALDYWTKYYERLGLPIPQGEPGISPGDLFDSELTDVIFEFQEPQRALFEELYTE